MSDKLNDTIRPTGPRQELSLWDSTNIIVGIIIGTAIYCSGPRIVSLAPTLWWLLGFWLLGGGLSLLGAVCYAELATAYPRQGGDYVYLTRALGRRVGFLFAWCQFWIVRPGSIGAMAYAFAEYAHRIWPGEIGPWTQLIHILYAAGAIVALSLINVLGVREGKWTQNLLTVVKVLGLGGLVLIGLVFAAPNVPSLGSSLAASAAAPPPLNEFGLAMIFVLFTYGGWNEMAYVAAEVRRPEKNILRAMLLGTLAVTGIYVLVNLAAVHALGMVGASRQSAPTDLLALGAGPWAGQILNLLVCISALGAINGQIFTGARIYYALGTEHRLFAWLGRWNDRRGAPVRSLLLQAAVTLALVEWFGQGANGFESMVVFTTPAFWFFMSLVGAALIILRLKEPNAPRPFRVPVYPLTPILFCLWSAAMLYASLLHAVTNGSWEAFWSIGLLILGAAACWREG
jgi:APA family basic amino acid/polyamine antiporter